MTRSLDNDNKKKRTEPESVIRSGKTISETQLRRWILWKSLNMLDMLSENRDICLRVHAASEKESAGLLKEANQAVKISLDILEGFKEFCKIAGIPDAVANQDKANALKRKILSAMKGIGNNDPQAEL